MYKNILIVRSDRMGDVVLTLPAIHALRRAWPQTRITLLVSSGNEVLVENHPDLDGILVDDRRAGNKTSAGFCALVQKIRAGHFDCCLNLHTKKRTNLAVFLAGIPVRIGFRSKKWNGLLTQHVDDARHLGEKHESTYCLEVLQSLGIDGGVSLPRLPERREHGAWLEQMQAKHGDIMQRPLILIHPGASDPAKCWSDQSFCSVMASLEKKKAGTFVLIGHQNVTAMGEAISDHISFPIINLIGRTDLSQLMYLVQHSALMISNDSGPVHLASAYQIPVVSIFVRNDPGINPTRWQPLGSHAKYVDISVFSTSDQEIKAVLEAVDAVFKLC